MPRGIFQLGGKAQLSTSRGGGQLPEPSPKCLRAEAVGSCALLLVKGMG